MASTIPVEGVSTGSTSHPEGPKTLTIEDLKANGTREKMYMLIHDKVYDLTQFMDEHPGGDEVMTEEAGRDATEAFEDVGHSDEARSMLPKMYVGDFQGEKSTKSKKAVSSTSSGTLASSKSGFPVWVVPAGLIAAFLAWRVFLA